MRRYWLEKSAVQGDLVTIEGHTLHHIRDVCRQKLGSRFEVLTGEGRALLVEVIQMGKDFAKAKVLSDRPLAELKRPHLHLALSLPRYAKMDEIVEKSVELGVKELHPFVSDFSFVRHPQDVSAGKTQRWEKIVKAATQQTGRGDLMKVSPVRDLAHILSEFGNQNKPRWGLFAYEGEGELSFRQALSAIPREGGELEAEGEIWLFVGSEGGFSPDEVQKFANLGLKPLKFGEQILRVETACVALLSVIKYEFEV